MAAVNENIRYEPDEIPPALVALGTGFQAALVILAPVALTVVIVVRIAEGSDSYLAWGVFAALLVSGVTTVLQAARLGRIGRGARCSSWARQGPSSLCAWLRWSRRAPPRWRA